MAKEMTLNYALTNITKLTRDELDHAVAGANFVARSATKSEKAKWNRIAAKFIAEGRSRLATA